MSHFTPQTRKSLTRASHLISLAEKDLVPYVEHFCDTMFKHLGVRVAVLCSQVNLAGELRVCELTYSMPLCTLKFETMI